MYSCASRNDSTSKVFKSFISDSLRFSYHQNLAGALNLPRINHGVDSFELRLYSSLVLTNLEILTCLRFIDSTWYLTETRYWKDFIANYPKPDIITVDSAITKKINPAIDYSIIIDSINFFDLKNMPDQTPQQRDRTADGMVYTIEIATKNSYRIISYHNPSNFQDSLHNRVNRNWLTRNRKSKSDKS